MSMQANCNPFFGEKLVFPPIMCIKSSPYFHQKVLPIAPLEGPTSIFNYVAKFASNIMEICPKLLKKVYFLPHC